MIEKIDLEETDCFSSFFIDYIKGNEKLKPFYKSSPEIKSFKEQITNRSIPKDHRKTLVKVLQEQYRNLEISSFVSDNIEALQSDKTFTITTGHQMNIFTGPLYFIYKLVSVINTTKVLKEHYPEFHFVPIYWMASEDHDFEEINNFHLFDKEYKWNSSQTGAVGKFDPSELRELFEQLPGDVSIFKKAYLENDTLSNACRQYVNDLFGNSGLVVLDADHPSLKKQFQEVMKADLFDHLPDQHVNKQTADLMQLGYKPQINSRPVNFFYMNEGVRSRIEKTEGGFEVVDTDIQFSEEEITSLISSNPERFSPNVVLRPLYQETILPNLAYIGGPSELVYWLQLKPMFDHFEISFPILMPRNFALLVASHQQRKWEKTGLDFKRLFLSNHELENLWLKKHSKGDLSYDAETNAISDIYKTLAEKAGEIDPTLIDHVEALGKRAINKLELAEKKLVRAEKRNQEDAMNQIAGVKNSLFPNGGLQERHDNFLSFYQDNPKLLEQLLNGFDPFDFKMNVVFA